METSANLFFSESGAPSKEPGYEIGVIFDLLDQLRDIFSRDQTDNPQFLVLWKAHCLVHLAIKNHCVFAHLPCFSFVRVNSNDREI